MRSRVLLQLMSGETGIPDRTDPDVTYWRNAKGEYHRDFGPAIAWTNGAQYWYQNGQLHRNGGPAIVWPECAQWWYRNGLKHRDDGPAFVGVGGRQEWWINGERIR